MQGSEEHISCKPKLFDPRMHSPCMIIIAKLCQPLSDKGSVTAFAFELRSTLTIARICFASVSRSRNKDCQASKSPGTGKPCSAGIQTCKPSTRKHGAANAINVTAPKNGTKLRQLLNVVRTGLRFWFATVQPKKSSKASFNRASMLGPGQRLACMKIMIVLPAAMRPTPR